MSPVDRFSAFYLSAARKSSGKTLISLGLGAALTQRGLAVRAFKKGPDYIDPIWHSQATGNPCLNLDFRLQDNDELRAAVAQYSQGAQVVLVEGNKGLYDGMDTAGSDSNAAMARLLGLPVVLVLDCEGMTRGIAPLLQGYIGFDQAPDFAGVILNRVAGERHEAKLCAAVEEYTDLPVLGAVWRDSRLIIEERHLGLMPANEATGAQQRIRDAAQRVSDQVEIDQLLDMCSMPAPSALPASTAKPGRAKQAASAEKVRIGVAQDSAFGFYYPDDLQAFADCGAEVVPIDTLNDQALPEVDGIFIGGGFPETHLAALSENGDMRAAICRFVEQEKPVYAECGGLMYLCRSIEYQGARKEMVGALGADVVMQARPVGRGYAALAPTAAHLWHSDMSENHLPARFHCHEFHYSRLENIDPALQYAYRVERGYGIDGARDGLTFKRVLANYSHLRHTRQSPWVRTFVGYVRATRA